jgi:hypothetical protein
MQEIFDHFPHRRAHVLRCVNNAFRLHDEGEGPVLLNIWVTVTSADEHDPAAVWKAIHMPITTLNEVFLSTFKAHPKKLETIGLPFNNTDAMYLMSRTTERCLEEMVTICYWDHKLDSVAEFKFAPRDMV